MKKSHLLGAVCASVFALGMASSAQATLVGRLPATPEGTDYQAYYDDVLDITWLANANLAASNTFGLTTGAWLTQHPSDSSGKKGYINTTGGSMNWPGALFWIDAMNADGGTGYLGFNGWRLPTLSPIDGSTLNTTTSNNATTDFGYAPTTTGGTDGGWRDGSGNPVSEMGHMYYVNLANLGYCSSATTTGCTVPTGWGLANTSPFTNLQSAQYWTGLDYETTLTNAWNFDFNVGFQGQGNKSNGSIVWAVHDGDVANLSSVPLPTAVWLFGSGLIGLIGIARKKTA